MEKINLENVPVTLQLNLASVAIILTALEGMAAELAADAVADFLAKRNPNEPAELGLQVIEIMADLERVGDKAAAAARYQAKYAAKPDRHTRAARAERFALGVPYVVIRTNAAGEPLDVGYYPDRVGALRIATELSERDPGARYSVVRVMENGDVLHAVRP